MGAPEPSRASSRTPESCELQIHGGTLRFSSAASLKIYEDDSLLHTSAISPVPTTHINVVEEASNDAVAVSAKRLHDILLAATIAIQDIDKVIIELQVERDRLAAEGEAMCHANVQYNHFAERAASSAKDIAKIMSQWLHHERLGALQDDVGSRSLIVAERSA